MTSYLADTNCLVAGVVQTHPHHLPAMEEMNRRLDRGERLVLSGHSLAEAYSVLTRSPAGRRVSPALAVRALELAFLGSAELVTLNDEEYVALVSSAPSRGIVGGRIYDAVIAECARKAGVDELLTFNIRHFEGLVPGVRIVVPQA